MRGSPLNAWAISVLPDSPVPSNNTDIDLIKFNDTKNTQIDMIN